LELKEGISYKNSMKIPDRNKQIKKNPKGIHIEIEKTFRIKIDIEKMTDKQYMFWLGFTLTMSSFIGVIGAFLIITKIG
jgi:hypothetical protein